MARNCHDTDDIIRNKNEKMYSLEGKRGDERKRTSRKFTETYIVYHIGNNYVYHSVADFDY